MREEKFPPEFELPFPQHEFDTRFQRVRSSMNKAGVDVTIVTEPRDFYWLTGSRTRIVRNENPGWIIIWEGEPIGVVRHLELSSHKCCTTLKRWVEYPDEGPIVPYDPIRYTAKTLQELGLERSRVGVNFRKLSVMEFGRFQELLPNVDYVDLRIDEIRIRKSKLEQECQFRAARANQSALVQAIREIDVGWTERDVKELIWKKHEELLGDEYEGSHGMVQVGSHVGHMHLVRWPPEQGDQIIRDGDIAYLETGTYVKRYAGSMLRMVSFGEPVPEVRKAAEASIEALNMAIEETAPGKTAHEVDKVAREHITSLGFHCPSRTAYSNGLVWSEGWVLSNYPNNPQVLEPGHILHYITLIDLPDWGFIGTSEQVLVTDEGHEVLGDRERTCPRTLFVK